MAAMSFILFKSTQEDSPFADEPLPPCYLEVAKDIKRRVEVIKASCVARKRPAEGAAEGAGHAKSQKISDRDEKYPSAFAPFKNLGVMTEVIVEAERVIEEAGRQMTLDEHWRKIKRDYPEGPIGIQQGKKRFRFLRADE